MTIRLSNWKDESGKPVIPNINSAYWTLAFLEKEGCDPETIIQHIQKTIEALRKELSGRFRVKIGFDGFITNASFILEFLLPSQKSISLSEIIGLLKEVRDKSFRPISIKLETSVNLSPNLSPIMERKVIAITYKLDFPKRKEEDK